MNSKAEIIEPACELALGPLLASSQNSSIWVGYSGGLDSTVLCHKLLQLEEIRGRLHLVHIHHGLNANADFWLEHCRTQAEKWQIPFTSRHVTVSRDTGKGLEAEAREARYAVFGEQLQSGDYLLLAHHRDDQAETLLLNLLRGAGLGGLAGFPLQRSLGTGLLLRPMAHCSRLSIREYANNHKLDWIEDDSNRDTSIRRNYLRQKILPLLEVKWPDTRKRLATTSEIVDEQKKLLDEYADQLLKQQKEPRLALECFTGKHAAQKRLMLRRWLELNSTSIPSRQKTGEILNMIDTMKSSPRQQVKLDKVMLELYQGQLWVHYLNDSLPRNIDWSTGQDCVLPAGLGRLVIESRSPVKMTFNICFRKGGERIKLAGRTHHSRLKKLFNEAKIPPWQRDNTPLLYRDGELWAIGDNWFSDAMRQYLDSCQGRLVWHRPPDWV